MYSLPVSYTLSSVPVLQDWSLPLFNGLLPVSVVGESVERELRCGVSLAAKVSRVSPKHTHERSVKTQIDFLKIHTLTWPTKMAYKTNSIYTHSCHKYLAALGRQIAGLAMGMKREGTAHDVKDRVKLFY